MKEASPSQMSLIISYLTLRKAVGILGTALPFMLSLGAWLLFQTGIQSSISSYYHTGMRDVFVGTLFAIGVFLLSYKGYEPQDNWAGNLASLFAIGVALFPTTPAKAGPNTWDWVGSLHLVFAALFFLTLIYFSLFLFTKTHPNKSQTNRKKQRNIVYKVCGYTMALCVLLIVIFFLLPHSLETRLNGLNLLYWLETVAILAFGVSWLTKGEAILQDED
ncbi:MAG: hypothetical protein QY332_12410 [Anaerolineales bacterium]|nr:MAG: hypothetical protein QY332_12410 [Anaerolineales bacterium]